MSSTVAGAAAGAAANASASASVNLRHYESRPDAKSSIPRLPVPEAARNTIVNNIDNTNANSLLPLDSSPSHTPLRAQSPSSIVTTPVTPTAHPRKPSDAGLYLKTDLARKTNILDGNIPAISHPVNTSPSPRHSLQHTRSWDSITSVQSAASSSISSPALAALTDVTPLPSPITLNSSPDLWRKIAGRPHSGSNASVASQAREEIAGFLTPTALSTSPQRKKKIYPGLGISTPPSHLQKHEDAETTRTVSEFVPAALLNARPRTVTLPEIASSNLHDEHKVTREQYMHREEYLAQQRGFVEGSKLAASHTLPTPPPSHRSTSWDQDEETEAGQEEHNDLLLVRGAMSKKTSFWKPLRELGQGAFSKVVLARREVSRNSQELVAIKIVSHIPTVGNGEERMETSIKREIEILQSISHPCLIQLKEFEEDEKQALLVMNYCAGGDLFELASQGRDLLTQPLIQRIFAELVAAVSYLHQQFIVHRDIKLENILVNLDPTSLPRPLSTYPHPIITLTDLGLSKRIPPPPASPLLTHPCGSTDYAAPELLLSLPYDGRQTDAWALGVLLYALLEGRLPFDALPVSEGLSGAEQRRRRRAQRVSVKQRIAMCEWVWCEYGDEEGGWVGPAALEGAREVVEGLLKKVSRGRWALERVARGEWVAGGVVVEGGLRVAL